MQITRRQLLAAGGASLLGAQARVRLVLDAGVIDLALDLARAPLSAGDFLKYVDSRAYSGGSFSRVVRPDNDHGTPKINVIQGGTRPDFPSWSPIPHESTQTTGLRHRDGAISLPRDKPGTAGGSEFFICLGDQPALDYGGRRNPDGQGFAAFGQVTAGMDLVRAIWRMDGSGASPDTYTAGQMLRHPVAIRGAFWI